MDQGAVLAAMLRRERLGSTAIGHGVAIPHARLEGISAPTIMLATLQYPVWFDVPDEGPVDLLLAVLWPKSDSVRFLQSLAYFCRLLRHPELWRISSMTRLVFWTATSQRMPGHSRSGLHA
jgi:PTS system nitrogen regulatory IIA component